MKKSIFLLSGFFLFSAASHAQVMGNYGVQQNTYQQIRENNQYRAVPKGATMLDGNTIEIGINALSNQQAGAYVAIFNLVQFGKLAEETNTLINTRIGNFIAELKTLGIPEEDIHVDMVNFLPKYEFDMTKKLFSKKTYTEIPKGFELQKNVHVRYKKAALLDNIVTAAAKQEIYDIVKVDYFVNDSQAIYSQLRESTFQYLKNLKKQYQSIGIQLDSAYVITAENAWVAYPINRYESYQAFSTQSLESIEKSSAIVTTAEKPISRFYNAIPANDYDIVINPEVLEPCVQFSYNLVVRFTMPPSKPVVKTEIKKEFIMVTPAGEVKTLKIE
ncbi:MAG: SIMPL domain-containing protein [Saprospiraceae bacterium]|nr:SIMPL domain-containing protein [Saprospiraceae bacterium]